MKTPIAAQTSPINYPIPMNPVVTTVPPGFSIPPSYISTISETASAPPLMPTVSTVPSTLATMPPPIPIDPIIAGATTTTSSAASFFTQPTSNYPPSTYKKFCLFFVVFIIYKYQFF